jgi:energy-coupling factor transport system substrate-specific component
MLNGLFAGFGAWWVPYLYIWTILWGVTMLLPKNMPKAVACVVYPIVCAIHGLLFGALYAPVHAIMFGFTLEQTLAWITAGFTFDIIHTIGNFVVGFLIYPMAQALKRLTKSI